MKAILVCGARPNFMKVAPLIRAIERHNTSRRGHPIEPFLVHTGQHYDYKMSQVFFENLELPEPDIHLDVGSGMQAWQTAQIMIEFEKVLVRETADLVIVVGDVNSTLAAALVAAKLHIRIAHVEAGLRSFDKKMPEEINRLCTDLVSDYLFSPSPDARQNLLREGVQEKNIFLVGNVMIDSLLQNKAKAEKSGIVSQLGLKEGYYAVLTLHRPQNVDNEVRLKAIIEALETISQQIPIIFPCHPRTRKNIESFGLTGSFQPIGGQGSGSGAPINKILLTEPLGYLDFLKLMMNSVLVITDSGGVQEETTALGTPCLTMMHVTDRPITVTEGTNILVGDNNEKLVEEALRILNGKVKKGRCPELWDGKAAERIIDILDAKL